MLFNYVGTKVHYRLSRKKEGEVLVLLHGWGASMQSFSCLQELKKEYRFLEIDFPPFGKSEEPSAWNVFSYANMVISLCRHLGIQKCHILGHSFGGRVAILVSVIQTELVDKVILVDSAGMKPRRKLGYYFRLAEYKLKKKLGMEVSKCGSPDYRNLSLNMKRVFLSIVSTHLEEYAKLMKQKTLIVFGENDTETPLYMARRLNRLIANSTLVVFDNCSHFCFQEKPHEFCKTTLQFLRNET